MAQNGGPPPTATSTSDVDSDDFLSYGTGYDLKPGADLVIEYFTTSPELAEKITFFRSHKRKAQTDKALVKDYKFVVNIYQKVMRKNDWPVSLDFT